MRKGTRPCVRARQPIDVLVGSSRIRATGISAGAVIAGSFGLVRLRESRLASVRVRPASAPLVISAGAVIAGSFGLVRLRDSRLASVRVRPASAPLEISAGAVIAESFGLVRLRDNGLASVRVRRASARSHAAARTEVLRCPRRVRFRENRLASMPVRPASLRAGGFLLLAQEKATKENGAPRSAALRASCAQGPRSMAGCADSTSLCRRRNARAPSRAPCGPFGHRPPSLKGIGNRSALLRAKAKASSRFGTARWSDQGAQHRIRHLSCAGRMPALALFSPFRPRQARADQARRGGAMDRAEFAVRPGMVCRQTPQRVCAVPRARCARDRGREGALLFGDFLLGKQEKDTGPQGCGTNQQGRRWNLVRTHQQNRASDGGASRNSQAQGCGTNQHGRQSVLAKANTTRTTHGFGASRNSQAQRCGTNSCGRSAFAKANKARRTNGAARAETRAAKLTPPYPLNDARSTRRSRPSRMESPGRQESRSTVCLRRSGCRSN